MLIVAAVAASLLLAEAAIRVWKPTPRSLIVRPGHFNQLVDHDGVPVWTWPSHDDATAHGLRHGLDCRDTADITVLVAGDSIFHGVQLPVEQTAAFRLRERLRARFPGNTTCVVSLAEPGHTLYTQAPLVHQALDAMKVDVLLLEIWGGRPRMPTRFDDTVYYFEGATLDDNGLPNPLRLPTAVHEALWRSSALWEYAHLALGPTCQECGPSEEQAWAVLDGIEAHAEQVGSAKVHLLPAFLDRPYAEQADNIAQMSAWYVRWQEHHTTPAIRLWEAMGHIDPTTLGMDACHFNQDGHTALLDVFERAVVPRIDPAP